MILVAAAVALWAMPSLPSGKHGRWPSRRETASSLRWFSVLPFTVGVILILQHSSTDAFGPILVAGLLHGEAWFITWTDGLFQDDRNRL